MRRPGLIHPRAPEQGAAPIWPPTQLGSCALWIDMLETWSYTVTSNTVTSIRELVGKTDATEGTNPPGYEAGGINGRPCLRGNNSNQRIISTSTGPLAMFSGNTRTLLAVLFPDLSKFGDCFFGAGNSATAPNASTHNYLRVSNNGGTWREQRWNDANSVLNQTGQVKIPDAPHVAAFASDSTSVARTKMFINRTRLRAGPAGTYGGGAQTVDRWGLFCRPASVVDSFGGDRLGCVIGFTEVLDDSVIIGLASALMQRFGIP